ncbi:uncharacterized protein LOC121378825 [Gigantopelta aegis]|uniref:uncharacterized protein LOC121378825 n=1 Tax=Gigantopelta aegis TaxID=1735272 RepID=UPI001B888611|nr:uncharacterized protein LOC121378825 [Gigantopelta aegis]
MSLVWIFATLVVSVLAEVQLEERGYLKLPINDNGDFQFGTESATESDLDPLTQTLYVVGHETSMVHVVDMINLNAPNLRISQTFTGSFGKPLDVQVCRTSSAHAFIAIAFEGVYNIAENGHVFIYPLGSGIRTEFNDLTGVSRETVGAHPDNIQWTSDCSRLVVSNEGIPYVSGNTFVDKPGEVYVLEVDNDGTVQSRTKIGFIRYDDQTQLDGLLADGFRYTIRNNPYDTSQTILISQNIEPEYIAINKDNTVAYITLQENNALARINLDGTPSLIDIKGLQLKDWSHHAVSIDASDQDNARGTNMTRRKIKSYYQPDKVMLMDWQGSSFLVTTDEGKKLDIAACTQAGCSDNVRAGDVTDWNVNDADLEAQLSDPAQLGRLFVESRSKDEVRAFGGRGFSILDLAERRVYESGDDIEAYSRRQPQTFNAACSGNGTVTPESEADVTSAEYGPELNSVVIGKWDTDTFMFFGAGQSGKIYVFALNPLVTARPLPIFQHKIRRMPDPTRTWDDLHANSLAGDAGIVDLKFDQDRHALFVLSAKSSSVSCYEMVDQNSNVVREM